MRIFFVLILLGLIYVFNFGCAKIIEPVQKVWGSSVEMLQEARKDAVSKVYDCPYEKCFSEIINILEEEDAQIFVQNKAKGIIVVMGIKKTVATSEVGVFLTKLEEAKTKIEISSGSPKAKRITSEILFAGLDSRCVDSNN